MTAANVATVMASGCTWAGIAPQKVLLLDADLAAPGLHYYDFVAAVRGDVVVDAPWESARYAIDRTEHASHDALMADLRARNVGFVHWVRAILGTGEFKPLERSGRALTREDLRGRFEEAGRITRELFAHIPMGEGHPCDPWTHIIRITDSQLDRDLCLFPAGDPEQPHFARARASLSWEIFISQLGGTAILNELFLFLGRTHVSDGAVPITRILLDQDAGRSLISQLNESLADQRVVVTGLNEQNRGGLGAFLSRDFRESDAVRTLVVVSQYDGRTQVRDLKATPADIGGGAQPRHTAWETWAEFSWTSFHHAERERRSILSQLQERGLSPSHIVLTDFERHAVQYEYFFERGSPSQDAIVQLVVASERAANEDAPEPSAPTPYIKVAGRPLRLLGECVADDRRRPGGPIHAFAHWYSEATTRGQFTGVVASHQAIVDMATKGAYELRGRSSSPIRWEPRVLESVSDKGQVAVAIQLRDFDLVALPVYAIVHLQNELEVLRLPALSAVSDANGPISEAYWRNSILGWERYTRPPGLSDNEVIGVPLFVECALVAAHIERIAAESVQRVFWEHEARDFEGFHKPADILALARNSALNRRKGDDLMLTLRPDDVAQWYEWQIIVGCFGAADVDVESPWETPSEQCFTRGGVAFRLLSRETVVATRYYLELVSYADPASADADWGTVMDRLRNAKAGIAFVWPDAVPASLRARSSELRFFLPPGNEHHEEAWLLCVPKGRSADAVPLESLERLLAQFVTPVAQAAYQSYGGVSVHRRVLADVDHWEDCAFLPHLLRAFREHRFKARASSALAYSAAKHVSRALQQLRKATLMKLDERVADAGVPNRREKYPSVWADRAFVNEVERMIEKQFSAAIARLRCVHTSDARTPEGS